MEKIYQHFRKEEQNFIDQVLSWKAEVSYDYTPKLVDFLDPREQLILKSIVGKSDEVRLSFWGGNDSVERKRALIYPEYYEVNHSDYNIRAFSLHYPSKFVSLTHPEILGSLMSLGLKREKFGDILIDNDSIQLIAAKEVSAYIELNFKAIGQAKVKITEMPCEELTEVNNEWEEISMTASSLRLDVILAEMYNLSRTKSGLYIEKGLVKVNFRIVDNPAFQVDEEDFISCRGLGRSKLTSIEGNTKKGKIRIVAGIKK
jgi:RNA-binding protein YlmH